MSDKAPKKARPFHGLLIVDDVMLDAINTLLKKATVEESRTVSRAILLRMVTP
jgi:hypothetical protein